MTREDPAFAAMALDLVTNVLGHVADPGEFGDYLATEIRELTGARLVLLVRFAAADPSVSNEIVGANPRARCASLGPGGAGRLARLLGDADAPVVWRPEGGGEAGGLLERLGLGLSLAVPLRLGALPVGALLALGLPEEEHWEAVADVLGTLSTIAALALRNAALYRRQEELIAERTRQLEAANEQLRRTQFAMDGAQDAVFWLSSEGAFTYVNDASCRLTGYSRAELLAMSAGDLHPPHAGDAWPRYWAELRRAGSLFFEAFLTAKDGRRVPVEVSANFLEYGGTQTNCSFVRDITERKRTEAEKVELERQLRHSQKMEAIGTFSGGIAHDFNNILTPIMAHAELSLLKLSADHPAREELQGLLRAAERAAALVQQILAISRKDEREPRPLLLAPLVKEVLKLLRASLPTTIEIRDEIDPEVAEVLADPTRVHQVLLNLCANARDAMGAQGGLLTVAVRQVVRELPEDGVPAGTYASLSVTDTGSGIPPELLERVFEPYFTTKEAGHGTGLGLAVVHGIVRGFGGHVRLATEPGKGTTFEVLLPECAPAPASEARSRALPAAPGRREHILFVDDEPAIVHVGRRMLKALGYEVTAVESSPEALGLLRADPGGYDLLITDQTMPHLTGAELARQALTLRPGLPVILCTGFSETLDAAGAQALGARAFVLKPFTAETLGKAVAEALAGIQEQAGGACMKDRDSWVR